MPYDKDTEDRALRQLYDDLERYDPPPTPVCGLTFCAMLLTLLGALGLLVVLSGCGTLAGFQQDVHRLTAPADPPPAPYYHTDR